MKFHREFPINNQIVSIVFDKESSDRLKKLIFDDGKDAPFSKECQKVRNVAEVSIAFNKERLEISIKTNSEQFEDCRDWDKVIISIIKIVQNHLPELAEESKSYLLWNNPRFVHRGGRKFQWAERYKIFYPLPKMKLEITKSKEVNFNQLSIILSTITLLSQSDKAGVKILITKGASAYSILQIEFPDYSASIFNCDMMTLDRLLDTINPNQDISRILENRDSKSIELLLKPHGIISKT